MLIGYARVSIDDQHLDLQNDALTAAGCKRIYLSGVQCGFRPMIAIRWLLI
jgi:DNA invertase Pin-like site-specific DNA recombinase